MSRAELDEAARQARRAALQRDRAVRSTWSACRRRGPGSAAAPTVYALAEDWIGQPDVDPNDGLDLLVRRYLGGFGPAPLDVDRELGRASRRRRSSRSLERMRLRRFADERRRGAARPARARRSPTPRRRRRARFLPTWDATLLAHARRTPGSCPRSTAPRSSTPRRRSRRRRSSSTARSPERGATKRTASATSPSAASPRRPAVSSMTRPSGSRGSR